MATAPVLPHNDEAERAVLGAVLLDAGVLEDVPLTSGDFYLERHQVIFETCRELAADGSPIDIRTLQAKLEHRGDLERVGGLAYLAAPDLHLPPIGRVRPSAALLPDPPLPL